PAVADEVDFMLPLAVWAKTGPQRWGVWHTPFYPWIMSLLACVFGVSVAVGRSIGLVSILGSALLIADCSPRDEAKKTTLLALALLSPVMLGSALLMDYDNTLLVLSTSFYFWSLFKIEKAGMRGVRALALLSGSLALCWMSKE